MPSFVARFDASVIEAYITKSVAPGAFSYALELSFDVYFPSSIPDLGGTFDPNIVEVGSAVEGSYDSLFPDNSPLPVSWETNSLSNVGSVPVDTWITVVVDMQNTGTNLWDVTWTIGGDTLGTDFAQPFDGDYTVAFPFNLGARALGFEAGQVFYMRNVLLTDAASTVLFSDDFSSGDFSNWDSFTGDCTVIDTSVNNVAKFDASVSDAYARKTLGPATVYAISTSVRLPSPAVMATFPSGNWTAVVLQIEPSDSDGLQYSPTVTAGGIGWVTYFNFVSPTGANIPDAFVPVDVVLTNNPPGSTTWDIVWNIDGTVITDSGVTLTIDNTGMLEFSIGALFPSNVASEIYYVGDLTVLGDSVLIFSEDWSSGDFIAGGWTVTGDASVVPAPAPPPPPPASRFFVGYPYRFIVTDLDIVTTTWADDLMRNRKITETLGIAAVIEADVSPDDFRVNGIWDDGFPRIAQSNRIIHAFRRDGPPEEPWTIAEAGIIMQVEDEGDVDVPLTHLTAYNPRKLLEARPVMQPDGSLPLTAGYQLFDTADVVVGTVLANTINNQGGVFIDAGVTYGGTSDWGGTIETCGEVNYIAQPGEFVADTWDNIEGGGLCDIILTPIYDPTRTITVDAVVYHFTHELSIFNRAGVDQYDALFCWTP